MGPGHHRTDVVMVTTPTSTARAASITTYSRRRFFILAMFSILTCSNAIQWIMFAPVPDASKSAFGLDTSELNTLSSIYMIVFVVGFFLSCAVIERQSLKVSLLVGATLNLSGALIKLMVGVPYPRYAVVITAQFLLAVSQVFLLSAPPLVADEWFPPHQRAAATAVGSMANNFGIALGMLVAPLMVTQGRGATSKDFMGFLGLQGALSLIPVVGIYIGMPHSWAPHSQQQLDELADSDRAVAVGTPNVGPTVALLSANQPSSPRPLQHPQQSTIEAMRRVVQTVLALLRHHDYRLLLVSFSVSIGSIWAMSSLLAQVLEPFGVSNTLAGMMGAFNLKGGVLIAIIVGRWVDRYRRYKLPLLAANVVNAVALSGMCLALTLWFPASFSPDAADDNPTDGPSLASKATIFGLYVLAGTAQNTVIPVCFEYAMEVTFPLPNSVPGAVLMAGGNVVSLILVSVGSAILGPAKVASQADAINTFALVLGLAALGGIAMLGARENLARLSSGK